MLKFGFAVVFLCVAIAPAQARHRHVVMAYGAPACLPVQEIPPFLYPAPDWGPFFRHHLYVSPVVTCIPVAAPVDPVSGQVISVRY